jgi:signal transduction histidine kinase
LETETGILVVVAECFPAAQGYGPWVEEVWYNYISNALKYGGEVPVVEIGGTEQEDGYIRFWLRDDGKGLTEDQQAKLFVPLARLEEHRVKGHGLGLSIVRRIVEKLNGQVAIESQVGKGSTFSFTLLSDGF